MMRTGWRKGATPADPAGPQERETKASKFVALRNINEELHSVAEEQHQQQGVYAQSINTASESEAKEHEVVRPKTTTASMKIATISWQHAALLRKAVFDTVPGTSPWH